MSLAEVVQRSDAGESGFDVRYVPIAVEIFRCGTQTFDPVSGVDVQDVMDVFFFGLVYVSAYDAVAIVFSGYFHDIFVETAHSGHITFDFVLH